MMKISKRKPGFVSAGKILNQSLSQLGLADKINLKRSQQLWPGVVGGEIADFTGVVGLTGKRLQVSLTNPEWRSALEPLQQDIALKLNKLMGGELIEEIFFETNTPGKRSKRQTKPKT